MVILITGVNGYIGKSLFFFLQKKYPNICGVDKKIDFIRPNFYKCNLNNKYKLQKLIKIIKPTHIIHLAGESLVDNKINKKKYYINNIIATRNLIFLSKKINIKKINSKYAIFFDPDGSYDASHILLMYEKIRKENLDIVYLNRLQKQEKGSMPFLNKYLGTPVLTFFINFLHGKKCVVGGGGASAERGRKFDNRIKDCNSGMRIFKTSKIKKINFISTGMEFASEFFIEAIRNNLKFKDYVGLFRKDLRSRQPHLHAWKDGWRHLHLILLSAPVKVFNFLFILILINYSLSFFLILFEINTSVVKYYAIVLLIVLNIFFQVECISICNFKQKYKLHNDDKNFNYVLNLQKKNFFILSSVVFFLFFIFLIFESLTQYFLSNNYFFTVDLALKLIIFANLSAFMINFEMSLDKNKLK